MLPSTFNMSIVVSTLMILGFHCAVGSLYILGQTHLICSIRNVHINSGEVVAVLELLCLNKPILSNIKTCLSQANYTLEDDLVRCGNKVSTEPNYPSRW